MQIHTKFLGEIEIQESEIITFEGGLLGLPEYTKYIMLALDTDLPLALLQSTEEEHVGFVVAYPFAFKKDYAFDISEENKEALQIENEEDILTYVIVTLKEAFAQSTLNLLAPVIINSKKKIGQQIVLVDNEQYPLRFPIQSEVGSGK